MMLEQAITRALEVLSSNATKDQLSIYHNPIDSHWLGTGLGYCVAKGWAEIISDGVFDITLLGCVELQRRLFNTETRLPNGVVPTNVSRLPMLGKGV